jgi:hypothetical protein
MAVSQQFGAGNQTDVFVVDNSGQLNVFWVNGQGAWQGPQRIGNSGVFPPAAPIAVSQQFGADNQTDVFLVDYGGNINVCWVNGTGPWQGPQLLDTPSPGSYGRNGNYVLTNLPDEGNNKKCNTILNLQVTIQVTEDIVCASATGATGPAGQPPPPNILSFGFQLNCYSPANYASAWQQYVVALWGNQLTAMIDNWPISGPNLINAPWSIATLPNKLPAGYVIQITLLNDSAGNVSGVNFAAFDNVGNTLYNQPTTLASVGAQTPQQIAPIVAFELDLVGPVNSESAVLSSGAGNIIYQSGSALTPLSFVPLCAEVFNQATGEATVTAETANSIYGPLPSDPAKSFSQTFTVSTKKPQIRRTGKVVHSLTASAGALKHLL